MSKKEPKADPISIRFDLDQIETIERLAGEERLSKMAVIRRLVDEALKMRSGATPRQRFEPSADAPQDFHYTCLFYTTDAADQLPCLDLVGRRLLKKKTATTHY